QAEDGIRDATVTGVQTCALPILTPVRPGELILGKMLPYLVLTFTEFCGIALLARIVFRVPMNGPFLTLLLIAVPFVLSMLAWGRSEERRVGNDWWCVRGGACVIR